MIVHQGTGTGAVLRSALLLAAVMLLAPAHAGAGILADAGIKQSYEDNINGAPGDAEMESDRYTTLYAFFGGYFEITEATSYLVLRAGIEGYSYATYDDLDGATSQVSVGIYHRTGEANAFQGTVKARQKDFHDRRRDSTSGAAAVELKQQVTERVWIKEGYEYERNTARTDLFTYTGHSGSIWSGILVTPRSFLGLGYTYVLREYDDAARYCSAAHTVSAAAEYRLTPMVFAGVLYERQRYSAQNPDSRYDNTITTFNLSYSY